MAEHVTPDTGRPPNGIDASECDAGPRASSSAATSGLTRAPQAWLPGSARVPASVFTGAAVGALTVVPGATRKASCESFVVVVAQRRPDCGPVAPVEAADQCPVPGGFGMPSAVRS